MTTCLAEYINFKISTNFDQLVCPIAECREPLMEIDIYQNGVNIPLYKTVKRNFEIIRSQGMLTACPTVDCLGMLDLGKERHGSRFNLKDLRTTCDVCTRDFCKDCKQPWHLGKLCKPHDIQWDMIGARGKA